MHVYAVREVTTYLRELFDSNPHLGDLWIAGECSNVSRPASGHVYFTLKDGDAQLRAAFFRRRNGPANTTARLVENGAAVAVHGRIGVYEQRGELQLYVDYVQPEGVGALQAEFERLKAQLEAEGLFDPSRKRPLPRFPARIGVATSESGAVFHDICHVLERRWPVAEVVLAPTPVQGPDAVAGIVGALDQLNRRRDIDVIIAGRGGGDLEELWAFNDELVARAIFGSRLPVVSAVGHETDETIADFVADVRAPTPSAAAEIAAPDLRAVSVQLGASLEGAAAVVRSLVAVHRGALARNERSLDRLAPDVNVGRQQADDLVRRGGAAIDLALRGAVQGVGGCVWRLKALDPYATLQRGYAIVQRAGAVVSSVAQARPGDAIDVRVSDGSFAAQVGGTRPARVPRRRVPDAQAPLFTMPEERA